MVRLNSIALASLFLAIFIPQLLALNYSIFSFEVGFFTVASVLLGYCIGYIVRSRYIFGTVLGFVVYFFLDAYFFEKGYAEVAVVVCLIGVPLLFRYAANGIPLAVFVFSVVFTLPDLFESPEPLVVEQDARAALFAAVDPPDLAYVHLILDEQMSPLVAPEAMPSDFTSEDFFDLYLRNEFKVYGLANSNSKSTFKSLSAIFGLTNSTENYVVPATSADYQYLVKSDRLVKNLIDLGFSITVIESTFLRLCGEEQLLNCRTYSRFSNMGAVEILGLPLMRRLELAFVSVHDEYFSGPKAVYLYQQGTIALNALRSRPNPHPYGYFTGSLVSVSILRDIEDQVTDIQPGEAIIAHVLVPHFPWVLDRDCGLKAPSDWGYPVRWGFDDSVRAYETFWDQSICTGNLIAQVLARVKDRDDVVVFVHGDHGGRILIGTDSQNDSDSLGTFLAVKSPNQNPGLNTSPVSLQHTFIREFMSAIGTLSPEN